MKLSNKTLFWITTIAGLFPLLSNYFNAVGLLDPETQKLIVQLSVAVIGYFQFTKPVEIK